VSVSRKLKWKKLVNQLRYMYEELDIVEEMASAAAQEFQEHYDDFCLRKDVDVDELNRRNADRIKELYANDKESPSIPGAYSGSTDLAPFKGERPRSDPKQTFFTEEGVFESETTTPTDEKEMHEIFSKLFKKLALQIHPDKINIMDLTDERRNDMLNMFTKARSALDERRYFILIDYAEKLGIPLPKNYSQQIRWMKKELEAVRGTIGDHMRTYNYMFAEADTDEAKDKLIRQFIQQLFQIDIP